MLVNGCLTSEWMRELMINNRGQKIFPLKGQIIKSQASWPYGLL